MQQNYNENMHVIKWANIFLVCTLTDNLSHTHMYRYTMIERKKNLTSIMTLDVRFKFLVYKMKDYFLSSLTFKNSLSFFAQYHTLTFCP